MKLSKEQLSELSIHLEKIGYSMHKGHYKSEDHGWWKAEKGYQMAVLVYDFSKYPTNLVHKAPIGIQFEFILDRNDYLDRMDFTVSDRNITVEQFEILCGEFYKKMCLDFVFKNDVVTKKGII